GCIGTGSALGRSKPERVTGQSDVQKRRYRRRSGKSARAGNGAAPAYLFRKVGLARPRTIPRLDLLSQNQVPYPERDPAPSGAPGPSQGDSMRIAPIDIAHKTFHRKMMGFDPDEVMDFLRQVAGELESLVKERNSLRETLREKELAVSEYRERDELLKSTITTATRMSEKMQVDAEREAKLILHDANQKGDMIVRE